MELRKKNQLPVSVSISTLFQAIEERGIRYLYQSIHPALSSNKLAVSLRKSPLWLRTWRSLSKIHMSRTCRYLPFSFKLIFKSIIQLIQLFTSLLTILSSFCCPDIIRSLFIPAKTTSECKFREAFPSISNTGLIISLSTVSHSRTAPLR
jgi:hypothetical protein